LVTDFKESTTDAKVLFVETITGSFFLGVTKLNWPKSLYKLT
jgi:hypothetical protein